MRTGIERAKAAYSDLVSLSIDTWGVDYVLLRGEEPVLPVYAYRDSRTESVIPEVHKIVPFSELYRHTGCQFQPFNSIYQIYADKKGGPLGWGHGPADDPGILALPALRGSNPGSTPTPPLWAW